MSDNPSKHPFYSARIVNLATRLEALPIDGEEILYWEEIDHLTGHKRQLLYAAKKLSNRRCGALYETVYRQGVRRAASSEAASVGKRARRRIQRTASVASAEIGHAVVLGGNDMSNTDRLAAYAEQRVLSQHVALSHQASVEKEKIEYLEHFPSHAEAANDALDRMRESLGRRKKF